MKKYKVTFRPGSGGTDLTVEAQGIEISETGIIKLYVLKKGAKNTIRSYVAAFPSEAIAGVVAEGVKGELDLNE